MTFYIKIKQFQKAQFLNILLAVPLCNFGTTKLQVTGNITKGHIFVAKNQAFSILLHFNDMTLYHN